MKFNVIGYYLREGFENLFKNKKSTFASAVTMFCTLLMFGIFMLVSLNTKTAVEKLQADQGIQVFIQDEVSDEDVRKIGEELKEIKNVNSVEFKSSSQALEDLKVMFKDNQSLLEGYESDPDFLPKSYIVKLTELDKYDEVLGKIRDIQGIDKVKEQQGVINALISAARIVNIFVGSIAVILVVVSILIISNTIKLTVFARRREISIMKYVGATNGFVKGPFIVEGIFIGLISTFVVLLILALTYEAGSAAIAQKIAQNSQGAIISLVPFVQIMPILLGSFLVLSVGLGMIGSTISMKKYLEV